MRGLLCATVSVVVTMLIALPAAAQDVRPEEASATLELRTSIKASALVFRPPDAPALFPERTGTESVWRLRVEPEVRAGRNAVFTVAYDQRLGYTSSPTSIMTVGILPAQSAPYRIYPLVWSLTGSSGASWRHEIDRASAQLQLSSANITVGRQAIGWGRGVMFGAVDLFAPFSPLEADREWRRGVDAVRADVKLTDRSSLDIVGAFGTTWDQSAVAARARGYAGSIDLEIMAGRRARDLFGGMTTSAAVGDAELHGEAAVFRVPPDAFSDDSRLVWKAVAGASYRFPIGSGILAVAEYHYSGFGAPRPELILPLLATRDFLERYLRGDTQILGRHALALTASYEASAEFAFSAQYLHNPGDRSGIVAPGLTYTISDRATLVGSVYIPYGRAPGGTLIRSEFGAASLSALLQLRLYL
jgi:hypothetical protein